MREEVDSIYTASTSSFSGIAHGPYLEGAVMQSYGLMTVNLVLIYFVWSVVKVGNSEFPGKKALKSWPTLIGNL